MDYGKIAFKSLTIRCGSTLLGERIQSTEQRMLISRVRDDAMAIAVARRKTITFIWPALFISLFIFTFPLRWPFLLRFFFSLLTPHQFVHCLWAVLLFFFRFITFPTSPTHICDSRAAIFVNYKFSPITARLSVGANQSQKELPPSSIVRKIKRSGLSFETATKQSIWLSSSWVAQVVGRH